MLIAGRKAENRKREPLVYPAVALTVRRRLTMQLSASKNTIPLPEEGDVRR